MCENVPVAAKLQEVEDPVMQFFFFFPKGKLAL